MNPEAQEQLTRWLRALPALRGVLVRGIRFPCRRNHERSCRYR